MKLGSNLVLRLGTEVGLLCMELGIALGEPLGLRLGTELGTALWNSALLWCCSWIRNRTRTGNSTWIMTGLSTWIKTWTEKTLGTAFDNKNLALLGSFVWIRLGIELQLFEPGNKFGSSFVLKLGTETWSAWNGARNNAR